MCHCLKSFRLEKGLTSDIQKRLYRLGSLLYDQVRFISLQCCFFITFAFTEKKQVNFKGKVVWITGASSGIGEALVQAFARKGAKIVLSSRNKKQLEKVQSKYKLGDTSLVLPLDLADSSHFDDLAKAVYSKYGQIDVLINNGGMSQRSLAFETPLEIDRKLMEINYFGNIALTKAVLPYMLKQQSGHVVAVSSIVGKFGFPLRSAYSASKHALHGFYETIRAELKQDGIRVTIAIPGRVKTNVSLNAILKDGSTNNKMDDGQDAGISADLCASKIVKAISKQKKEVLIGRKEILLVHIRRFFPFLYYRIVDKVKPT